MTRAQWKAAEPFLTDSQMRVLVAIKNGHRTAKDLQKATHRSASHIRGPVMSTLKKWGLVYYAHGAHEWHLTHDWPGTLEEIKKRIRWHMEQLCLGVDDFADPPELEWLDGS